MMFSLDLFAATAQIGEYGLDAVLVDGTQGVGGNAQFHPAILARHPEAALVQVRQPAAPGFVVGMRHAIAGLRALATDLADFGHRTYLDHERAALGQGGIGPAKSWIFAAQAHRAAYYSRIRGLRQANRRGFRFLPLPYAWRAGSARQHHASRRCRPGPG